MKIIKLDPYNPKTKVLNEVRRMLAEGKVIIYPTDTLYGLGANAFDEDAIKKVYSIKKRSFDKPISICVPNMRWIRKVAYLNDKQKEKISKLLPGPYTIILEKKDIIPDVLTAGKKKVGIRIPKSKISIELAKEFPITATSANISGRETPPTVKEIIKQLKNVDLAIDVGPLRGEPSTVIDFTTDPPKIIRGYFHTI